MENSPTAEMLRMLGMQCDEAAATVLVPLEKLWNFTLDRSFLKRCVFTILDFYRAELILRKLRVPRSNIIGMNDTLKYVYFYHYAYTHTLSDEDRARKEADVAYIRRMAQDIVKQYIFAEHIDFKSKPVVTRYSPIVNRYKMYCNFLVRNLTGLRNTDIRTVTCASLIVKALMQMKCIFSLLSEGLETEAVTVWRSLYELECVVDILISHDESIATEFRDFEKCSALWELTAEGEVNDEEDWLKQKMQERNIDERLKTPFMRFGWLMALPEYVARGGKLNFKNGLQLLAGNLERYPGYKTACLVSHPTALTATFSKEYLCNFTVFRTDECLLKLRTALTQLLKENQKDSAAFYRDDAIYRALLSDSLQLLHNE